MYVCVCPLGKIRFLHFFSKYLNLLSLNLKAQIKTSGSGLSCSWPPDPQILQYLAPKLLTPLTSKSSLKFAVTPHTQKKQRAYSHESS